MDADDDWKLFQAAVECLNTGTLTALLKEELKYHIQTKRLSEGKNELHLEETSYSSPQSPLGPEDIERQKKRREQNRRAATKFRLKKKSKMINLQNLLPELQQRNADLHRQVEAMTAKRDALYANIMVTKATDIVDSEPQLVAEV